MRRSALPPLSPSAPRFRTGPLGLLARALLKLHGWRIVGRFPDEPKLVLVGFPHTSNWDGYFGVLFVLGLGLKVKLMIKHTALEGPFGGFMRWLGFVAVDRTRPVGVVGQIAEKFAGNERFWLGITPEGTRKGAAEIKTGFHRIARAANVPLLPVCIDFRNRCIRLLPVFETSEHPEEDVDRLLRRCVGLAWPRHVERLSAPMRRAMTREGELVVPPPEDR